MSNDYICNMCAAAAYYDGRCGDGPVLLCGCNRGEWVDDGRGGFYWPTGAKPVRGKAGLNGNGGKVKRKIIIEYE